MRNHAHGRPNTLTLLSPRAASVRKYSRSARLTAASTSALPSLAMSRPGAMLLVLLLLLLRVSAAELSSSRYTALHRGLHQYLYCRSLQKKEVPLKL